MLDEGNRCPRRRAAPPSLAARLAVIVAAVVAFSSLPLDAAGPVEEVAAPAQVTEGADRLVAFGGVVSVSEANGLSAGTIAAVISAAASVGASATESSGYSIGMAWVRRGDTVVQRAGAGAGPWQYPMSVTVLPAHALTSVMSAAVGAAVGNGMVAMGETTAAMRGARAGDTIGLVAGSGEIVEFTIGTVAPDSAVGGTEIVMSPAQAALLGATETTRVLVHGSFARPALDAALATRRLVDGTHVRVVRSWDARSPDSTLGTVRTKQLLGEFAYQLTDTGITIDPAWVSTRLPSDRIVFFPPIPIRARCHFAIQADLHAALTEVHQSGLAGAIDVGNTNAFGGCFNPRFNRVTGNLGFLSRHAWAQAIDMNTSTNAQGSAPQMDCRVVRIFRKHNFAWGGNFLIPDGMHFEWVGEPRHTWQYPSEYCPNVAAPDTDGLVTAADADAVVDQRATMFADDGW